MPLKEREREPGRKKENGTLQNVRVYKYTSGTARVRLKPYGQILKIGIFVR